MYTIGNIIYIYIYTELCAYVHPVMSDASISNIIHVYF
jgi:hypothetical protein